MKFNRQIGDYAGKMFSVDGNPLSEAEYKKHLEEVLPGPEERKFWNRSSKLATGCRPARATLKTCVRSCGAIDEPARPCSARY